MDPDQPAHLHSLIRIHAVCLPTLLQVEKLIANSMDQTARDAAHMNLEKFVTISKSVYHEVVIEIKVVKFYDNLFDIEKVELFLFKVG
jgi:hypothetical protein